MSAAAATVPVSVAGWVVAPGQTLPPLWLPEQPGNVADDEEGLVAAFKQRTQQRYIDKAAEQGILALHRTCVAAGVDQERIDHEPGKVGLLIATDRGPEDTRERFLNTYARRGGKSVSATLFSNCGYNIVGSNLARSYNIRGPVLTLSAAADWPLVLFCTALRLFAARRVDLLFVARAEPEGAVVICLDRQAPLRFGLTPARLDDLSRGVVLKAAPEQCQSLQSCLSGDDCIGFWVQVALQAASYFPTQPVRCKWP
nr:beta-ketoacyl synthase N-terminal-like domain-containing protein [Dendrosporobacter quercicolus]